MYLKVVWGITIPRQKVCEHHSTPFEALAQAYFGETPISIWKASRGFGGKSQTLAALVCIEAATLGAEITVLGGSAQQSQNVHDGAQKMLLSDRAPDLLKGEPTKFSTKLKNEGSILALMASEKSVRGPHPQRLRLDEVDELETASSAR
jgi:hypothetical protein